MRRCDGATVRLASLQNFGCRFSAPAAKKAERLIETRHRLDLQQSWPRPQGGRLPAKFALCIEISNKPRGQSNEGERHGKKAEQPPGATERPEDGCHQRVQQIVKNHCQPPDQDRLEKTNDIMLRPNHQNIDLG